MSTPRCTAKLNGNPPPTCRLEQGHTGDHESLQPHGILSWADEGVAAPLEPSEVKELFQDLIPGGKPLVNRPIAHISRSPDVHDPVVLR